MLNVDIAKEIAAKGFAKERIRADAAEPKSNDDLRRLGIQRIAPSVKGKDSINNGITAIQEYKICVHPSCKNTLAELGSYCWKKDKTETELNVPEDKNNHLMDAMRYAFYDVKWFRPEKPEKQRMTADEYYNYRHGITAADLGGF
jgi:phage terminase large subunit